MDHEGARLSIGLPVYNGDRYLSCALDSILKQTYQDFELIISDNASTDATEEISRSFAAQDSRIRYSRNEENLGAAQNFNRVFKLSTGSYFKWAAHDDLLADDFLQQCVDILDQDPGIILAHTKAARIDENGRQIGVYESRMNFNQESAHERFHDLLLIRHPCTAIFGVIRREVLAKSALIGGYVSSDRTLLAELGLRGRIYEVPKYLFFRRDHSRASTALRPYDRLHWFNPHNGSLLHLPNWRLGFEYLRAIQRAPLNRSERLTSYRYVAFWFKRQRFDLLQDLFTAAQHLFS